jgi:hypothetical protein
MKGAMVHQTAKSGEKSRRALQTQTFAQQGLMAFVSDQKKHKISNY